MRRVAIIQARATSTRLPGKVLMELVPGRSMLDLMLERMRACRRLDAIVVAVPENATSDAVAREAERCGAIVFRGSEEDVLGRYLGAALVHGAEMVVRVTSDCPLIDPDVVDLHVATMEQRWRTADFVTNMFRQTYPLGLAVEAMPLDTLVRMNRLTIEPAQREHVTSLAYDRPELFATHNIEQAVDQSGLRWTVDYPADMEFVRSVFAALYAPGRIFRMADVLRWLERGRPAKSGTASAQ